MPITQQRMTDLLCEYEKHLDVLDLLARNIRTVCAMSEWSAEEKVRAIEAEVLACAEVPRTCAVVERRHFDSHAARNEYMRSRMERLRRASGIVPRTTWASVAHNTGHETGRKE
jgi:hypothetical protein